MSATGVGEVAAITIDSEYAIKGEAGADLKYVERSGAAIGAGRDSLKDLKKNGVLRSWYVGKQRRCRDWNRTGFAGWVKERQDSHARLKRREYPGERPWLDGLFQQNIRAGFSGSHRH
ncbi:hypothetical protein KIH32_01470 [Pseudomonas fluorescens]|uniref:hypothetical protein n=1 Tax=Pseudomonas fluorescens TaxID=294 RepID=UPI001BD9EF17|nr:hypothetical protein [Pseudomonas fluorescens]